jgi:hypothetical protein
MSNEERTVPVVPEAISNEVIRLREWGTDWIHMLPPQPSVSEGCAVRLFHPIRLREWGAEASRP